MRLRKSGAGVARLAIGVCVLDTRGLGCNGTSSSSERSAQTLGVYSSRCLPFAFAERVEGAGVFGAVLDELALALVIVSRSGEREGSGEGADGAGVLSLGRTTTSTTCLGFGVFALEGPGLGVASCRFPSARTGLERAVEVPSSVEATLSFLLVGDAGRGVLRAAGDDGRETTAGGVGSRNKSAAAL